MRLVSHRPRTPLDTELSKMSAVFLYIVVILRDGCVDLKSGIQNSKLSINRVFPSFAAPDTTSGSLLWLPMKKPFGMLLVSAILSINMRQTVNREQATCNRLFYRF